MFKNYIFFSGLSSEKKEINLSMIQAYILVTAVFGNIIIFGLAKSLILTVTCLL